MSPNSPACRFIHASMAGSCSTAPFNRNNSVRIIGNHLLSGEIRNRDIVPHHCACGSKEERRAVPFSELTPRLRLRSTRAAELRCLRFGQAICNAVLTFSPYALGNVEALGHSFA